MFKTTDPGIDYSLGTANKDHETGIHYGVISQNKVEPEAINDIAVNGDDLGYEEWLEQIKTELKAAVNGVLEDYTNTEIDSDDAADLLDGLELDYMGEGGPWAYSDNEVTLTLGTDGDIFITKSIYYTKCQYCSPCAPGAGYLTNSCENGVKSYCLGPDWFEGEPPYPVFRVDDDSLVAKGIA